MYKILVIFRTFSIEKQVVFDSPILKTFYIYVYYYLRNQYVLFSNISYFTVIEILLPEFSDTI